MKYFWLFIICLALTACGPTSEEVSASQTNIAMTVIADITAQAPTSTNTPIPTNTQSPTLTPTPAKTPTPRPTNTPVYGTFRNPAPIGITMERRSDEGVKIEARESIALTLLDVLRGDEANQLAKSEVDMFSIRDPIEGQEYIAIKLFFDVVDANPNKIAMIVPFWALTLRYEKGGSDIWSVDAIKRLGEGYPPISGEGWVFFLIRKDTQPLLYFQPHLALSELLGFRTSGAYFSLEQP